MINLNSSIGNYIGNYIANQLGAFSSIANYATLVAHLPEEFAAKFIPLPGGYPMVRSKPNFSPMVFSLDIYAANPTPTGPKLGNSKVSLPGDASSILGADSPANSVQAATSPLSKQIIPPLVLLVNPSDMTVTARKAVEPRLAKGGWVVEHWGEELDTLSVSGRTGAFVVGNLFESRSGLTRIYARNSAAYQNLMALYLIYKNNGYNYETHYDRRRINSVGTVNITYDWTTYKGSFRSFSITEDANSPFQFSYNFEFVVREWSRIMSSNPLRAAFGLTF